MNMKDTKLDLDKDRKINPNDVMESLFNQSVRFSKYATAYSNAKAKVERKKVLNELLYAKLDIDVRTNPEKYDIGELKEKLVEAAIKNSEEYKEAIKEYFDLNDEMHKFDAAKKTMEQRSYMLTNIVQNLATGVRSVPNVILDDHKVKQVAKDSMEQGQINHLKNMQDRQRKESK